MPDDVRKSSPEFVVLDSEGWPHLGADEQPERFTSFKKAQNIARNKAIATPGLTVRICQTVAEVVAPVGEVKVTKIEEEAS